ncbi:hypothetical protein ACXYRK_03435 [Mycoplasma sp. AC1221]
MLQTYLILHFQEQNNAKEQIPDFLRKISDALKSIDGSVWIPVMVAALIIISFGFGFLYNWKYIPVKITAIILSIIASIVSVTVATKKIDDSDIRRFIPLLATLVALITYWVVRFLGVVIIFFIHIFYSRKKYKVIKQEKPKKHFLIRFLAGGLGNMIVGIPGTLLFANVLSSSTPENSSVSKASKFSVYLMTGGKGESYGGLVPKIINILDLASEFSSQGDIQKILEKAPDQITPKDQEKIKEVANKLVPIINDERLRKTFLNKARENNSLDFLTKNFDKKLTDDIIKAVKTEQVEYNIANDQKKKEIATNYITNEENLKNIYEQYVSPNLDKAAQTQLAFAQKIIDKINSDAKKDLNAFISSAYEKVDPNSSNKFDVRKTVDALTNFIATYDFSKNKG